MNTGWIYSPKHKKKLWILQTLHAKFYILSWISKDTWCKQECINLQEKGISIHFIHVSLDLQWHFFQQTGGLDNQLALRVSIIAYSPIPTRLVDMSMRLDDVVKARNNHVPPDNFIHPPQSSASTWRLPSLAMMYKQKGNHFQTWPTDLAYLHIQHGSTWSHLQDIASFRAFPYIMHIVWVTQNNTIISLEWNHLASIELKNGQQFG